MGGMYHGTMTNEKITSAALVLIISGVAAALAIAPVFTLAHRMLRWSYLWIPTYLHVVPALGYQGTRRYRRFA